ncbi:MAG: DUF882 domain-containing protein [Gemmatimonadota bacterium]|jgi:hypothetical protein
MMDDVPRTPIARILARFEQPGLSRGQERVLNLALLAVTLLLTGGWAVVIARAAAEGTALTVGEDLARSPLSSRAPPPATFLLDRIVAATRTAEWRGRSGAVRALIVDPDGRARLPDTLGLDSLPPGTRVEIEPVDSPAVRRPASGLEDRPGVFHVLLRVRNEVQRVADVTILNPVPSALVEGGRLGRYLIGEWPSRAERPARLRTEAYDPPAGLIAVTPENRDVPVSEHLVLGDFLTKGQNEVWPKYVAITPALLDKIELTLQELERTGHPVEEVGIISGFRTPWYNAHGGNTGGRGSVSRHMYGDALDFYIDNDGDGAMDDLDGDGRITRGDARVIAEAVGSVEERYPEYVGGVGIYGPRPGAHSGFVHVDARGYRARW